MEIRALVNSQIPAFRQAILPELTLRQKAILAIAMAALTLLAAYVYLSCNLKKHNVSSAGQPENKAPKHAEKAPVEVQRVDVQSKMPPIVPKVEPIVEAPTTEPPRKVLPPEEPAHVPEEVTLEERTPAKPDEKLIAKEEQVEVKPMTPPLTPRVVDPMDETTISLPPPIPFTYQGLDRASVERIINFCFDGKSLQECEKFAPGLLGFIRDDDFQKKWYYPDSDLPEGVRIADSRALGKYLHQKIIDDLIDPTLRLLVLNGDIQWCGTATLNGTFVGLDLIHLKTNPGCFTRNDLLALDYTMRRECWKEGDLPGLNAAEADLYKRIVHTQKCAIFSRLFYKNSQVMTIKGLNTDPEIPSLLKKLMHAGKIHAYNFALYSDECHLMLTPKDQKLSIPLRYIHWVDQQLLQTHQQMMIQPDSQIT